MSFRIANFSVLSPILLMVATSALAQPTDIEDTACCGSISPRGAALARAIDASNVEHLWLARQRVNWETGEGVSPSGSDSSGRATHCSAFAAAFAMRLGVYMLRPPEHSAKLLASAQTIWFSTEPAKAQGWKAVASAQNAQQLANQGSLVLVSYASPDPKKPGHIAIVRPAVKSDAQLQADGPQIAQAGMVNSSNLSTQQGFSRHPGAWPSGVRYFQHEILEIPPQH